MPELPTLLIRTPGGPVRINAEDFDPERHERYEEKPAEKVTAKAATTRKPRKPKAPK